MRGTPTSVTVAALALSVAACGGGGGGPTGPASPPPPPGHPVSVMVFLDENENGLLEASEVGRVPDVEVQVGGRTARTAKGTGIATVENVPAGTHAIALRGETLPPFYSARVVPSVTTPADGTTVRVPVVLPIGHNRFGVYVAFGDSITRGTPASNYPSKLEQLLRQHFNDGLVINRGDPGTNSYEGVERARRNIEANSPAYTLILYGTNDWNIPGCQEEPVCDTIPNLRAIVRSATRLDSLTFIATLTPVNPAMNADRNRWVEKVNDQIRAMAVQEGAVVVDVYGTFTRQGGDLSRFFEDHVHPNDAGYALVAEAFFEAIAHGR
ncbi:MAG TPA: SGNH/GDSL hydrolase family protein [Vicinamibacteria bacterium]|nr:SGNH/GDSL hydrolase family protein [Vicinamibacteria bacterium]